MAGIRNYLELCLLWFFGYSGVYVDRMKAVWVGEVEAVPWK